MANVPWTQFLAVASEAGLQAPGVGVREDPHCTSARGQGGREARFPGVGAPQATPAPPLARLLTQTASPRALSLPLLSNPISWKQEAVLNHPQGFTRPGAITGVNTLGQDRKGPRGYSTPHAHAIRAGPRLQGPARSVLTARSHRLLTNASSEEAESHCTFPEEGKGLMSAVRTCRL